jgi:Xaa-Pro aminopeptidase
MAQDKAFLAQRRKQLRERCSDKKIDAYLTFDFSDTFYLTGFPSEGCFVLCAKSGDYVFAPPLLLEQLQSFLGADRDIHVLSERSLLRALEKVIQQNHLKKIGFDPSKLTVSLHKSLSAFSSVGWVGLEAFVLLQRKIKDAQEIDLISKACQITYASSQECFKKLSPGQSEKELSEQLEIFFKKRGADKIAFETIVAFGAHSAYPHHVVTPKKLTQNTTVLIDLGCSVAGYKSDLTRTRFFGKLTTKFEQIYKIVQRAQQEGMASVRDGISAGKIDAICRKVIGQAGYGDYFVHGTGHGVGIDIHEPPRLGLESKEILKKNMVVTVEPGIYLPGEFGVRIEDTLLVTQTGSKILTKN